jgi:hypothetical protein
MNRAKSRLVAAALATAFGFVPAAARAQAAPPPAKPASPPAKPTTPAPAPAKPGTPAAKAKPKPTSPEEMRFRLVLNFAATPGTTSYGDLRTPTVYAETSQITTSYDAGTGLGPGAALQVSLYRGLGLLVGYSYLTRDASGSVDDSRPHPLYLNQPRTATAALSGQSYSEGAIDVDAAYAQLAGSLDYALFGGVTFFKVKADLLGTPTFNEAYPYSTVTIASTPSGAIEQNTTGWNVGGRLDYRFGASKRFGAGVQLRYSNASVLLAAAGAVTPAKVDAGGFSVGAGLRIYF